MNIGSQDGFHLNYFPNIGEPDLARRLHILSLLDQNSLGIIQQGTFNKQKRTVFFKAMY